MKKTSLETKRKLFRTRVRMEDFKANFKHKYMNLECDLCKNHIDTQEESVNCPVIANTDKNNLKNNMKV